MAEAERDVLALDGDVVGQVRVGEEDVGVGGLDLAEDVVGIGRPCDAHRQRRADDHFAKCTLLHGSLPFQSNDVCPKIPWRTRFPFVYT